MASWTTKHQFPLFFLVPLLALSPLVVIPVRTTEIISPYDWIEVGAYAKYFGVYPPAVVLPNGTTRQANELYSPLLFEWTIVNKQGSRARLNVTLFFHGTGWYYDEGLKRFNLTYRKTVFVDVQIYTRESFVDNESIGVTPFWADPYAEKGDNVTVFSDPDLLEANVWWVRTANWFDLKEDFKMYGARLRTEDPYAHADGSYVFSWYTGIAIEPTFLGPPYEVPPDQIGSFKGRYRNGTSYNIIRYAGTKLGTHLGLAPYFTESSFAVDLNQTNIDLTLETSPEPPPEEPPPEEPPPEEPPPEEPPPEEPPPEPASYALNVQSTPITSIQYTVDSRNATTGTPITLAEGNYTITMPSTVTSEGVDYTFQRWENGATNPRRSISLTSNTTLTATYVEQTSEPPPTGQGSLEVHAYMDSVEVNAYVTVDGTTFNTTTNGATVDLDPTTYTVTAAYGTETLTESSTITEGKTTRLDFQFTQQQDTEPQPEPPPEDEPAGEPQFEDQLAMSGQPNPWQYLPYAFLIAFTTTAAIFVIQRRRGRRKTKKNKN